MALDQYSYCPCGSGKKIKFCKCADNFQEMQKVDRMIEGEQSVAALDRINQLLKTFPTDAWLHAMKCHLLLKLREVEQLEEASAKFIRLRPDNTLAQMFRSLLSLFRGNIEESATLFLQGLSDAGGVIDAMVPTVALNLINTFVRARMTLSALMHCEYLMDFLGDSSEPIAQSYNSIVGEDRFSLLTREMIPSASDVGDQAWSERFQEAYLLLNRQRIPQAKSKFESLQREFGPVPQILVSLLHCKLLMADIDGAAAICSKLADAEDLRYEQRIYFKALQFELDPKGAKIDFEDLVIQYNVDQDPEFEATLLASPILTKTENDQIKQMASFLANEEIPPKYVFVASQPCFDGEFEDLKPRLNGTWVAYFGRQTDKPARLLVLEPEFGRLNQLMAKVATELGLKDGEVLHKLPSSYEAYLSHPIGLAEDGNRESLVALSERVRAMVIDSFLNLPLKLFDSKTPLQMKGNPQAEIALQALLLHWQCESGEQLQFNDYLSVYDALGLKQPSIESTEDVFDLVGAASYFWTNMETIDSESLIRLMQSAMTRRVNIAFPMYIASSRARTWSDQLKQAAEYTTLNMEVRVCEDLNLAAELLEKVYDTGRALDLPVGNAVLERVDVLRHLGRESDAAMFFQRAMREVPKDPYLLQYIQMIRYQMQQQEMQAMRGDVGHALNRHSASRPAASPASTSSGLWTPDGGTASAPDSASNASSGSKLWLPGQ